MHNLLLGSMPLPIYLLLIPRSHCVWWISQRSDDNNGRFTMLGLDICECFPALIPYLLWEHTHTFIRFEFSIGTVQFKCDLLSVLQLAQMHILDKSLCNDRKTYPLGCDEWNKLLQSTNAQINVKDDWGIVMLFQSCQGSGSVYIHHPPHSSVVELSPNRGWTIVSHMPNVLDHAVC